MFNNVITNLAPVRTRYEALDGKRYLVVPMVMLTVGVHNGSRGPLYYPKEELANLPLVWDHKPGETPPRIVTNPYQFEV